MTERNGSVGLALVLMVLFACCVPSHVWRLQFYSGYEAAATATATLCFLRFVRGVAAGD